MPRSTAARDEQTRRLFEARRNGDVAFLMDSLRDPEWRDIAATFLGEIGDRHTAPRLLPLLEASDDGVRVATIRALGRIRADVAISRLADIAEDKDEQFVVRSWAISSLGLIGDPLAASCLGPLLRDDDQRIRRLSAEALGVLGDPASRKHLVDALASARWRERRVYRRAIRRIDRG